MGTHTYSSPFFSSLPSGRSEGSSSEEEFDFEKFVDRILELISPRNLQWGKNSCQRRW
jgi:hypothetical protein